MPVGIFSARVVIISMHKEKPGIIISVGKHGTKEVPKGTVIATHFPVAGTLGLSAFWYH